MEEIDVWHSAYQMMKLYPDGAERAAVSLADSLLELGEVNGFRAWKQVASTIRDLEQKQRDASERTSSASSHWKEAAQPRSR